MRIVFLSKLYSLAVRKYLKAQQASAVLTLEIVFGSILAYLFLNERISIFLAFGGMLVLSTNIFLAYKMNKDA